MAPNRDVPSSPRTLAGVRAPQSPSQSATFAMARVLILFAVWQRVAGLDEPLELERAMLIDFASQYPRTLTRSLPALAVVLRAYRQQQDDLADVFVVRRFGVLRERFGAVVTDLLSRRLLEEVHAGQNSAAFTIAAAGGEIAQRLSTTLSFSYRAVYEVLCDVWRRKNADELFTIIKTALPDEARLVADLSLPLPAWIEEGQWANG